MFVLNFKGAVHVSMYGMPLLLKSDTAYCCKFGHISYFLCVLNIFIQKKGMIYISPLLAYLQLYSFETE
jgi:hypothetical protein